MSTPAVVEPRFRPGLHPGPGGMWNRARDRVSILELRLRWLPPLLVRFTLGCTFVSTGWGKLHNLARVTRYFTELRLPAPAFLAGVAATTEFVCGLLVLFGLFTRLAAIPAIVLMAVAIATARLGDVHGLADFLGLEEWLYALFFFWLVVAGPGRVSLDGLIFRDRKASPSRTGSTTRTTLNK